jgi:hypothetical protein
VSPSNHPNPCACVCTKCHNGQAIEELKARCLAAEARAEVTKCCFCENVDGPTVDLYRDEKNPGVASPYCMNCVRELISQGDHCEKVSEVLLRSATLATKMLTKNAEDLATLRAAARQLVAAIREGKVYFDSPEETALGTARIEKKLDDTFNALAALLPAEESDHE